MATGIGKKPRKRMVKGFVFGKFLPFHKGHEALIRFALQKCDQLTVLVCKSNLEKISGEIREAWIEESFGSEERLEIRVLEYDEEELPNTSESSVEVSRIWSNKFKVLFPDYSLVVTSEKYGDYLADFMGITHVLFDNERLQFPVSSTLIRKNIRQYWHYLPEAVKFDLVFKVVLLGTESTGKTTLTNLLASHFNASIVNEAGRDLIPDSNDFSIDDLYRVAKVHAENIALAARDGNSLIIIDTDIHTTLSYAKFSFNAELKVTDDIYAKNKADLYLYLNCDTPYVQDGTRLDETVRNELDKSHRAVLVQNGIECVEITGNWNERFRQAVEIIEKMMEGHLEKFRRL